MKQGPGVKQAQKLLQEHGERGWAMMVRQFGHTWSFQGSVVTADPVLVHKLLSEPAQTEHRPTVYRLFGKIPGTDGILFKDGEAWRARLKALMPSFNKAHVDPFIGFVHEEVTASFEGLCREHDGVGPDLFAHVMKLGLRLSMRLGYGIDPDLPQAAALGQVLYDYKCQMMRPECRIDSFGLTLGLLARAPRVWMNWRGLKQQSKGLQAQLQALAKTDGIEPDGWLRRLADTKLSLQEQTCEVNHLYGAYNAIDYILTSALHELWQRPQWVERLRAELDEVLQDRPHPERADFERMPLMDAFMRETLRRYPVSLSVARQVEEPIELESGETLEKGAQILILLHALHHDEGFWKDPFDFNPERWLDPEQTRRTDGHYVPFLYGRRKCIGRVLAEMEFMVVLSALLRGFELNIRHEAYAQEPYMIPRIKDAIPFRVRRREVRA